jgi:ABC-type proline/glycine betaine transport system permease subunit
MLRKILTTITFAAMGFVSGLAVGLMLWTLIIFVIIIFMGFDTASKYVQDFSSIRVCSIIGLLIGGGIGLWSFIPNKH